MSYYVAIVTAPIPADDKQAWAAVNALVELEGERPAVLQNLHDQLTARYPCMSSLPDDEIDDAVWSDGPLINNFRHRAATLGISFARDEVMPFLIKTATGLGLFVFDWQTDTIHRPGDKKAQGMTLQLESGKTIRNVTEESFSQIEGEEFAILAIDDETYIQCAEQGDPPHEYVLEYQAGSVDEHYSAVDEPITLDRIIAAFRKYLRGDPTWRDDFEWQKMDLS